MNFVLTRILVRVLPAMEVIDEGVSWTRIKRRREGLGFRFDLEFSLISSIEMQCRLARMIDT